MQTEALLAPDSTASAAAGRHKPILAWGIFVFVLALLVRVALALPTLGEPMPAPEPVQVAISLMTTGNFADAYGPGSGPTAHCSPLHPILLSFLLRMFGTGVPGSAAMRIFGAAGTAAGFALLPALGVAGGVGLSVGVAAGLAGALLPFSFWGQTNGAFDTPLTGAVLIALAIQLCRLWAAARFTRAEGVKLGIAAGFGCLLNPAFIPVLAMWGAESCVRYRHQLRRVLVFFAVATVCVVAMLSPWAIRNYRTLGALIWTRSNLGMELQISNNDIASPDIDVNLSHPETASLHPFTGAGERAKVRAMGEVAYHGSKKRQAFAWIGSHPRQFLLLSAGRFRLFWFPTMKRAWQTAAEAAMTLLGLAGLAWLCWKRHPFAWIAIAVFLTYPDVYYLVQVSARHRVPVEPLLFLLIASPFSGALGAVLPWTQLAHRREAVAVRSELV